MKDYLHQKGLFRIAAFLHGPTHRQYQRSRYYHRCQGRQIGQYPENCIQRILQNRSRASSANTMYLKKYNFLTSWLTGTGKFRDEALEQDRMTIINYLHNQGYADASVDIQILDDPASDKIIVDITADRGTLYHCGQNHYRRQLHSNDRRDPETFPHP